MKKFIRIILVIVAVSAYLCLPQSFQKGDKKKLRLSHRISGGSSTMVKQPSMVAIYKRSEYTSDIFICGGALIGARRVLTSAQCCAERYIGDSQLLVRYNGSNLEQLRYVQPVENKIIHPKYVDSSSHPYDFCMLILTGQVEESSMVKYAKIANSTVKPGANANLYGWGLSTHIPEDENIEENEAHTNRLKKITMPILSTEECKRRMNQANESFKFSSESMICGKNQMGSGCWHDLGGPLFHNSVLVGVLSSYAPNNERNNCPIKTSSRPNVFANPVKVEDWIMSSQLLDQDQF